MKSILQTVDSSMSLYNLVHLPINIPKATTVPEAKAVVDKEWGHFFKTLPELKESKVTDEKLSNRGSNKQKGHNSSFCNVYGLMPPKTIKNWTRNSRGKWRIVVVMQ